MNFIPIFTQPNDCNLWSTCYPEDEIDGELKDIYSILMDERWSDNKYLFDFIKQNEDAFSDNYWNGISVTEVIDNIHLEIAAFDEELYNADRNMLTKDNRSIDKIFLKLHDNIYSLNTFNESYRKAKPNIRRAIIRFYGIELEDKTLIITGGTLKFKQKMIGVNFDMEIKNLKRVRAFLNKEGIIDRTGLIE